LLFVANSLLPSVPVTGISLGAIALLSGRLALLKRYAHVSLILLFVFAGVLSWSARHVGNPGNALQRLVLSTPVEIAYNLTGRVERPGVLLAGDDYSQFQLQVKSADVDGKRFAVTGGVLVRWVNSGRPLIHEETVE
jgi:hypothetical protein